jgi:hypothetical protein
LFLTFILFLEKILRAPQLALQQLFARIVESVERIREQQVASGRQIEGLYEGMMAKAFGGVLVV